MENSFVFQGITFLWDVQKAQINLQKHGVTFEQACEVFFDPFLRIVDASAEVEARDAVIGVNSNGKHLFVVHIQLEEDCFRIISARKLTKKERLIYENY
ncbi:MAG: BrnT family toxin [Pseudomonadota bacterium]